ncbi:hypothetical protein [Xanthobacter agilis]|jgi:hypothetical protein|uniref:Sulfotransferase domain-containing protein n=1 Tax=Xanthobacter agilis TaxID=47492 RepID=A0ABU0L7X1_XANAG|nr:hypothetical protein [Xanthobacter agilis]MDQ0503246.1 hypothetical protein [Xanthobacter agilis]
MPTENAASMETARQVVVHLGMMKSASTTIQRAARRCGIIYRSAQPLKAALHQHRGERSKAINAMSKALHDIIPSDNDKNLFLSHESLIYGRPEWVLTAVRRVAPAAHIFIIVRNPNDWIRSYYRFSVSRATEMEMPASFLLRMTDKFKSHYALDQLLPLIERAGFADRFTMLPFELLSKNPAEFSAALARHLGLHFKAKDLKTVQNAGQSLSDVLANLRFNRVAAQLTGGSRDPERLKQLFAELKLQMYLASARSTGKEADGNMRDVDFLQLRTELEEINVEFADGYQCLRNIDEFAPFLTRYGL